jgi:hypothetical protein
MIFFEAVRKGEIVMHEQFTGEYNLCFYPFFVGEKVAILHRKM